MTLLDDLHSAPSASPFHLASPSILTRRTSGASLLCVQQRRCGLGSTSEAGLGVALLRPGGSRISRVEVHHVFKVLLGETYRHRRDFAMSSI